MDKITIWHAAMDESGVGDYALVSAVLGQGEAWPAVFKSWDKTLREYNIEYYHGTDFNCGTGVAKGLSEKQRVECVKKLIGVISNARFEYVCFALNQELFSRVNGDFPTFSLSIYDYLQASTIGFLQSKLAALASQTEETHKAILSIEEGAPSKITLSAGMEEAAKWQRLAPISVIRRWPKSYVPCQVADLIAYDSCKTISSAEVNHETRTIAVKSMRRSFEAIIRDNPMHPFVVNEDWLRTDIPAILDFLA